MVERSGDALTILLEADQLSRQFNMTAVVGKPVSQDLFNAPLRNDQRTCIRDIRRRVAAFVHVTIAENFGAVVATKRQVKAAAGEDFVDDSKVIQNFHAARLQALPA